MTPRLTKVAQDAMKTKDQGAELKVTEFSERLCVSFVLGTGTGKGGG